MRLNDAQVKSLPAPQKGAKVYHDTTPGLVGFGLRVTANGARAFVLTYGPRRERITIGRYPLIGLADARAEARRILAERTLGRHRPRRMTFQQAVDAFLEERKTRNRPKTHLETGKLLRGYFRALHAVPLEDIAAHHVTDITDKLSRRGLQSTASHAHTAVKTMLKWCAQRQYIPVSPIADLEKPALPKPRERVLSDEELKAVWQAAEATPTNFGRIVQLLILTGARRSEVQHMRLDGPAVTLDASVTKNKRPYRAPVCGVAQAILEANPDLSWGGWSKSKKELDEKVAKALGRRCDFRLHDLRRTAATNWQKHCGALTEDVESLLGHVTFKSGLIGTYQRWDRWPRLVEIVSKYNEWLRCVLAPLA